MLDQLVVEVPAYVFDPSSGLKSTQERPYEAVILARVGVPGALAVVNANWVPLVEVVRE